MKTIAVTGKGGTGKTLLVSLMLKAFVKRGGLRLLVIDADSASSLCYTLGVEVHRTVSDMRHDIIGAEQLRKQMEETPLHSIMDDILEHGDGFDLLTMGRPEEPGCYCVVNDLLKYAIDALAADYDIVIVDGEAGPEQINRRVLSNVDTLLIMSDGSWRSLKTAKTIVDVAEASDSVSVGRAGVVLNRVRDDEATCISNAESQGMKVWGILPEDQTANEFDRVGTPLLQLPDDSPLYKAVCDLLEKIFDEQSSAGSAEA